MKKTYLLSLLLIATSITITGCNINPFAKSNKASVSLQPYMVMNKYDRSALYSHRAEISVYINEKKPSADTLRKYANELVKSYDNYNGVIISFYDVMEETYNRSNTPVGIAVYAPQGQFKEALHINNKEKKIVTVNMNKVVYTPKDTEKELYNTCLKELRTNPKITNAELAKKLNKDSKEITELLSKMSTRYKEVASRD